jgi:hypothetical protein
MPNPQTFATLAKGTRVASLNSLEMTSQKSGAQQLWRNDVAKHQNQSLAQLQRMATLSA